MSAAGDRAAELLEQEERAVEDAREAVEALADDDRRYVKALVGAYLLAPEGPEELAIEAVIRDACERLDLGVPSAVVEGTAFPNDDWP